VADPEVKRGDRIQCTSASLHCKCT